MFGFFFFSLLPCTKCQCLWHEYGPLNVYEEINPKKSWYISLLKANCYVLALDSVNLYNLNHFLFLFFNFFFLLIISLLSFVHLYRIEKEKKNWTCVPCASFQSHIPLFECYCIRRTTAHVYDFPIYKHWNVWQETRNYESFAVELHTVFGHLTTQKRLYDD